MTNSRIVSDIAVIAVVLACCIRVSQRSDRLKRRFGSIGSPLIDSSAYRALFLLVLVGVLLIAVLPEAVFVLPALDAVGLDVATILVALELRHYLISVARLLRVPGTVAVYRREAAQFVNRWRGVMRTNPIFWLYACIWPMIWVLSFFGKMRPRVHL